MPTAAGDIRDGIDDKNTSLCPQRDGSDDTYTSPCVLRDGNGDIYTSLCVGCSTPVEMGAMLKTIASRLFHGFSRARRAAYNARVALHQPTHRGLS